MQRPQTAVVETKKASVPQCCVIMRRQAPREPWVRSQIAFSADKLAMILTRYLTPGELARVIIHTLGPKQAHVVMNPCIASPV